MGLFLNGANVGLIGLAVGHDTAGGLGQRQVQVIRLGHAPFHVTRHPAVQIQAVNFRLQCAKAVPTAAKFAIGVAPPVTPVADVCAIGLIDTGVLPPPNRAHHP